MSKPVIDDNWTVEDEYRSRMNALEPYERVERMVGMFNWTREMIGRQVIAELGQMSHERLRWEVALRMYASEPEVCEMIKQKLADVSN